PETSEPDWIGAVAEFLAIGGKVDNLKIEIGAGLLWFAGTTSDEASYQQIIENLTTLSKSNRLRLKNQLARLPGGG
ncbi:MAG: hypothetical protein ACR2QW_20185, partial [bacterium]